MFHRKWKYGKCHISTRDTVSIHRSKRKDLPSRKPIIESGIWRQILKDSVEKQRIQVIMPQWLCLLMSLFMLHTQKEISR